MLPLLWEKSSQGWPRPPKANDIIFSKRIIGICNYVIIRISYVFSCGQLHAQEPALAMLYSARVGRQVAPKNKMMRPG